MSRVNRFDYKDFKGLGKRTKMYREQINMSKEKFAEKINRSENFVAELEKGNVGASVHTLHQISQTLKISVDSLLYGEVNDMKHEYKNKEILHEIIDRCTEEELEVIKDVIVALYPNLGKVLDEKK